MHEFGIGIILFGLIVLFLACMVWFLFIINAIIKHTGIIKQEVEGLEIRYMPEKL